MRKCKTDELTTINRHQGRLPMRLYKKSDTSTSVNSHAVVEDFDNFIGFWLLETIDYVAGQTMIEFYRDPDSGAPKAKFYEGLQNEIREINNADVNSRLEIGFLWQAMMVPPVDFDTHPDTCDVIVQDSTSVQFLNSQETLGFYSRDQLRSTFKIQSYDNNLAFCVPYTQFDATSDSVELGAILAMERFRRLPSKPPVQERDELTQKWDNPVNIFNYVYDVYTYQSQNERRDSDPAEQYIGNVAFEQLRDTLLTTGIIRTNTVNTEQRAGKFVGVWRTVPGNTFPTTTIRLQDRNRFYNVDNVTISGFLGPYSVLNGTHPVSFRVKGSVGPYYEPEFVLPGSEIYTVHIAFDSSSIPVEYNPSIHGIATLSTQHGPVTPQTQYRELLVALAELQDAFGISTHNQIIAYSDLRSNRLETYADVQRVLADDDYRYEATRGRSFGQNAGRDLIYFNPTLPISRGTIQSPIFDPNDPYGLGPLVATANASSKFNIDIDIANYLEVRFTVWWAVTGPVLPDEPVTSTLEDAGYGSNGSQLSFTVTVNGEVPPPLVDEFGEHPYNLYQFSEYVLFGGIVRREYTESSCKSRKKGEIVAYIRIRDEGNEDDYGPLFYSPLVFGRNDMPQDKYNSNVMTAFAVLLEALNEYKPDRYILDIRENAGGQPTYPTAWAAFFGANRPSHAARTILDFADQPERTQLINGSVVESVFNSIQPNVQRLATVQADLAAEFFPKAVVRGSKCHPKRVVLLTNFNAASAGDVFVYDFLGSDQNPPCGIHDLGHNVLFQTVGSIDGRLYSAAGFETTPISNPNPYKYLGNPESDYPLVPFRVEQGITGFSRFAPLFSQELWYRPGKLIPSWYEKQWQDIGVIPQIYKYPLKKKTEVPDFNDNSTWRDLALEYAITQKFSCCNSSK